MFQCFNVSNVYEHVMNAWSYERTSNEPACCDEHAMNARNYERTSNEPACCDEHAMNAWKVKDII